MPSQLETALETIVSVFYEYAGKEGDRCKLNKEELKELLQNELSDFLKTQRQTDVVDKLFHEADYNDDQEVNFEEFSNLMKMALITSNCFFSRKSELPGGR